MFKRKLRIFNRSDAEGEKMTSRFSTLVNMFSLKISEDEFYKDYSSVDRVMSEKRIVVYEYLKKAFEEV